jgi:hypothetical protein
MSTPAMRANANLLDRQGSTLALLVPRVLADHPQDPFPADELAILADFLD